MGAAIMDNSNKLVTAAGWLGLLAATMVGIGESLMQFTPSGGIEDIHNYLYFNDISSTRLSRGHFMSVLFAPFYIAGYWFLSQKLKPAGPRQSRVFFWIGAYAFAVGTAWIGQRIFLAGTVHEIANGQNLQNLLAEFSAYNEPFVNVLRVAMLVVSVFWVKLILTGKTAFPKWMAIFNPITLLALIAASYFLGTKLGLYLFPAAMNVTHFIIFALALAFGRGKTQA